MSCHSQQLAPFNLEIAVEHRRQGVQEIIIQLVGCLHALRAEAQLVSIATPDELKAHLHHVDGSQARSAG